MNRNIIFALTVICIFLAWAFYPLLNMWFYSSFNLICLSKLGEFGDLYGSLNALFSGLAFTVLIYALFQQQEDLKLQKREMEITNKELAGQRVELERQNSFNNRQLRMNIYLALMNDFDLTIHNFTDPVNSNIRGYHYIQNFNQVLRDNFISDPYGLMGLSIAEWSSVHSSEYERFETILESFLSKYTTQHRVVWTRYIDLLQSLYNNIHADTFLELIDKIMLLDTLEMKVPDEAKTIVIMLLINDNLKTETRYSTLYDKIKKQLLFKTISQDIFINPILHNYFYKSLIKQIV